MKNLQKNKWTVHAEENAICIAAKHGYTVKETTLYCTLFPCSKCTRMIIQSGITHVVSPEPDWEADTYAYDFRIARVMFEEARIDYRFVGNEE